MITSPIKPTIPLDVDGIHHGFLRLPFSRDRRFPVSGSLTKLCLL